MPIYEYECNGCGAHHEFIQKFNEGPKRKCPSCGRPRLRKQVSAAAFHLKGNGWYVTDFRDKNKAGGNGKDNGKDGDSGSKDAKSSAGPKDSGKSAGSSGKSSGAEAGA